MDDLESLVHHANNYNIARFLNDHFVHPYTEEAGKAFINMVSSMNPARILAIAVEGKAVGAIGLHPQTHIEQKNAELGYWLAEPFWGKGIATRAVLQMVDYGFAQLPINRIFARPFGNNIASQKVLEKAGFVLEAQYKGTFYKNGEYLDELVYAVRKPTK